MRIKQYKTVRGYAVEPFDREVNALIDDGWEVFGPIQVGTDATLVQTLVKLTSSPRDYAPPPGGLAM